MKGFFSGKNMTERIGQPTGEVFKVQVIRQGKQEIMSLQRCGDVWILDGDGISGTAPTAGEVFVTTLGIFDGKKAARRWSGNNNIERGVNYE